MTNREVGLERMREILGKKAPEILSRFEEISPDFADILACHAYGDVYARPLLSDKVKEVAAVANLMGQGKTGLALKTHLLGMLTVGWSPAEVLELILFLTIYNGFPSSVEALYCFNDIMQGRKKE